MLKVPTSILSPKKSFFKKKTNPGINVTIIKG